MLLFWVVLITASLPLLFFVRPGAVQILGGIILGMVALAVVALCVPTWGARQALRRVKTAELDRVRDQILEARESREDARLPGLLAWEARVQSAPEWPIDARSLRLTGLYVLIPVLSWTGGALVERIVDALMN